MGQQQFKVTALSSQTIWFVIVGILAATTHFGGLIFWVHFIHVQPKYANMLAFVLAFIVSFIGHYRLTFQTINQIWYQALWRWLCSSVVGFLLNQILFTCGLSLYGQAGYIWIWLMVTFLVTVLTFLLGKFWAFRFKDQS